MSEDDFTITGVFRMISLSLECLESYKPHTFIWETLFYGLHDMCNSCKRFFRFPVSLLLKFLCSYYYPCPVGQWMALPSMTTRRSSVGVAAMNGVVYAVGGYDGQSRQCLNSVELYDTRANRWRIGEPLLEVRSGAGVAIYRDRLIAAGGHDGPVVRATVEMLSGDGWVYLPEMSVCRRNAGVVVANGFVFALGGDDGTSNLSSVECLEIDGVNQCWNTLQTEMQQARSYCGVTLLPKI